MEQLIVDEVKALGGEYISSSPGVVLWRGDLETGYRSCLWSRCASRIFLQIDSFTLRDGDDLYERCLAIDWLHHLDLETTFAIDCTLTNSAAIKHSNYAALRLKDAIVDQFRQKTGQRPSVQKVRPGVRINLHIDKNRALVALDLSGEGLHRRGYRVSSVVAPLKETLAAAIVRLSGYTGQDAQEVVLDPMCGSGTLLIEAALLYGDVAPGLSRPYFGFLGWKQHRQEVWTALVEEAIDREDRGLEKPWPQFIGYDDDPKAVSAARKNIERAGLDDRIQIKLAEVATLNKPAHKGVLLCNPPYGERLLEIEEVGQLYRGLGSILRQRFGGWRLGLFIANADLNDRLGIGWQASYKLHNGPIRCCLYTGEVKDGAETHEQWRFSGDDYQGEGEEFANRLVKNLKRLSPWTKKEAIDCFRLYDADLPEYNLAVDIYHKWIHVQEYAPASSVDSETAMKRFRLALAVIRTVLGVPRERVFIKTRSRQKGKKQYQKQASRRKLYEVRENNVTFLVNFTDYLDTGLFLDHRPMRQRLQREAAGKRFLNLFGYTGSATIAAAAGGAAQTTTVDLSNTYLHWTRLNLARNGYGIFKHTTVKSDCLQWLTECRERFDLIFIDPPTFSNTKKAKLLFDVQRDHKQLLERAMELLDEKGTLYFSTNFRKFSLDTSLTERYEVTPLHRATIPVDFERNSRIHMCWQIGKK